DKSDIYHSKSTAPTTIIDTLGAGDTFNAALIHSLVNNNELQYALDNACKLASHKCGQQGFANLTQDIEL
ncbi:MAG: ketohexokinase, partial [Proteobacteria bacterium]|nr:ketohexokinase [Pseudomonadota bacterium]